MNTTEEKATSDIDIIDDVGELLHQFSPISLAELETSQLMTRFDEKYVFPSAFLPQILAELKQHYHVLNVNDHRVTLYHNIYFDTKDLKAYHDHHNQRVNRFKVRFRHYSSSDVCFLEVKKKDNRRLTHKQRVRVDEPANELSEEHNAFLFHSVRELPLSLHHSLSNRFHRITLVNESNRERVTLDTHIHFMNRTSEKKLTGIAIAELKLEKHYEHSVFKKLMQQKRIFPMRISKYCIGMMLTHEGIKQNRFKRKLLTLKKYFNDLG